jgi:hypothetical protein
MAGCPMRNEIQGLVTNALAPLTNGAPVSLNFGEMTDEQASVVMGQRLFQKFAPATVNSNAAAPSMSYADYYKKFGGAE